MRKFKIFLPILVVLLVVVASFIPPSTSKYVGRTQNYSMTVKSEIEEIFYHNGSEQTFKVPVSGFYYISAWGGNGGRGGRPYLAPTQGSGGESQQISGIYYLAKETGIFIYVGSAGVSKDGTNEQGSSPGGTGGTNGLAMANGGAGGKGDKHKDNLYNQYSGAGGGGGAGTFVCTERQNVNDFTTLICSGGGGGSGGGSGNRRGDVSVGGAGGAGGSTSSGVGPGENGKEATYSGAAGGIDNSSGNNGTNGEDGYPSTQTALIVFTAPGGGGGGGGSGYTFGGSGGYGGVNGGNDACKGGGGGKGGSSYISGTVNSSYSTPTHTRPTISDGAVIITYLGP